MVWLRHCVLLVLLNGLCYSVHAKILLEPVNNGCIPACYCDSNLHSVSCYDITVLESFSAYISLVPEKTTTVQIDHADFIGERTLVNKQVLDIVCLPDIKLLRVTHSELTLNNLLNIVLPKLRVLDVASNMINDLSLLVSVSVNYPQLQVLTLSDNYIQTLDSVMFSNTGNLTTLDLSDNNITDIDSYTFQYLPLLTHLNLAGNQIAYIHPALFGNLTSLTTLNLHNNKLTLLHHSLLNDFHILEQLTLHDNPWDCNCGLEWLRNMLLVTSENNTDIFTHIERVQCATPVELQGLSIDDTSFSDLTCADPVITNELMDQYIQRMYSIVLYCNVSGTPTPSVYWLTPHGITAHSTHRRWMDPGIVSYHTGHSYDGLPTYIQTEMIPRSDGSLLIKQMRNYFSGEYTCIAENPAGIVQSSFNVTVVSPIKYYIMFSLIVGGFSAVGFLLFGILVGSIRMCFETMCCRTNNVKEPISEDMLCRYDYDSGGYLFEYVPRDYCDDELDHFSPVKCPTPAEQIDADSRMAELAENIRCTLEDVRIRLWMGMGRRVDSIRTHAHHIRTSSSQYMATIRESSSSYIHNVRSSSSSYIHNVRSSSSEYSKRMKANMAIGVESVKYHVQSMKEYCGTGGDMMHTVSAVSVTTDVDTSHSTVVCRRTTMV